MNKVKEEKHEWADLLRINWRPAGYEIVLLLFGLVSIAFVSMTPLYFSTALAKIFAYQIVKVTLYVYILAALVTLVKGAAFFIKEGKSSFNKHTIIKIIYPYWSLGFFILTIRRALAVFGIFYFFLHLKHVILLINKANHDLFLWNLDRLLHFGVQPNVWMMESFGLNHDFSITVDWLYIKYFKYMQIACLLFFLEPKGRKFSEKFFLAFTLLWALGGIAYLAAPADGPCYSILVDYSTLKGAGNHIFKFPVIDKIPADYARSYSASKIWYAKSFQDALWVSRARFLSDNGQPGMFYGIAAMPSLHVAVVALIALFFFPVSSILGVIGSLYAVIMLIGSVLLQWHYAVDGYAGIALALIVWRLSFILSRTKR
ncbi:hypothetical protein MNBD_NITROSPINAE03-1002 [hydrothermal vent metagenome]|uniref:Inositolphosphotransferase Aur1/Ipt1 domain-containing protein n=1 Tax=hydrothermal vent metagenome TaxID=652676 RepID=A0A3B1C4S1_9ZZZZ